MKIPTRQRLIDAALRRFYRDGFRNVGVDQILADVGISKTAFYKHFQCKDDLMLAVLEDRNRWLQKFMRKMIRARGGPAPRDQLHAIFDVVQDIIETEDFQGCIFVNAAMEFPLPHDPAHLAAAENKASVEEIIADLAAAAGADDPLAPARELCLIIEGTYITRHVTGKPETIDAARRLARLAIDARMPPAKPARPSRRARPQTLQNQ